MPSSLHLLRRLLAASLLSIPLAAQPPFAGTIFIDPDIIKATDPSAFSNLTDAGRGVRQMYDRRFGWVNLNAFLFRANYDDGLSIEVQINPEFATVDLARLEALRFAPAIGQLPHSLRIDVKTVWIHKGVHPFGGGNNNLLIHVGQATEYINSGILEETFVHEASHTSLDATHAASSGWLAAQAADPEFISTYARDNPTREDVAESFLPYLAIRYRSDRISTGLANTIIQAIPQRIAYFNSQQLDLYPLIRPQLAVERRAPNSLRILWPSASINWRLEQTTDVGTETWEVPPEVMEDDGVNRSITIREELGTRFFRLAR
ncbi:MAG: hypothetical protein J0M24_06185 [Verrucomicrobia bacterium]|nr:hypothetical protein [Verrucomicrobiota bacterium]